jgi:DNA-binding beta-propeller fold protein YncE
MYRLLTILLAAIVPSGAGAADADAPPLRQIQTIPLPGVKGRIDHLGLDVEGMRLYVAALGNNTVEVIDLAEGKQVRSVAGLKKPTGIRVLPGSRNVVVASGNDGKVRVYSPGLQLVGIVDGLDDADNVRLDPEGALPYVGYGDGAIAVIDPQKPRKVGDIKIDGHPEAFQLEAGGDRMFVNVPTAGQVAVIDRKKQAVIAKWPVREAEANFPMALDEAHHRLFIGCRKPAELLVLDTGTGKVVASVACCGDTDDLFYDPAANRVYLSGGDGNISVIEQTDADHYRVAGAVQTAPGARTSLFVPELSRLYLAVPRRGDQGAEVRVFDTGPARH